MINQMAEAELVRANSSNAFDRAVVIGCGMGGIAAAAALKDYCNEVVIIEKDAIPSEPVSRRGVPQDEQLHNLLSRAQQHFEELLPGFIGSLSEQGVGDANVAQETHVYELGTRMPERNLGLRLMSAWRPVIEHSARSILLKNNNVALHDLIRVAGLKHSSSGEVCGVEVESSDSSGKVIEAPIVVDASGTGSKANKWLRACGIEEPIVDTLQVNQWYVSMLVKRPDNTKMDGYFWLTFPTPPQTRGGLVSPVGAELWYLSLSGRENDEPPRSFDEMKQYAATLEDEAIAELLEDVHPVSSPNLFKKAKATWRRYDLLDNPLPGFLPLGDSVASLNPLFGQGMSVAAWQAAELKTVMEQGLNTQELTKKYLGHAAVACEAAWTLGNLVNATGPLANLNGEYWDKLASAIKVDSDIHRRYVGIWHLIEPVSTLYHPEFTARINELAELT